MISLSKMNWEKPRRNHRPCSSWPITPYLKTPDEKDNYYNLPLEKRKELLALYKESSVVAVIAGHTHKTLINDYHGIQLVNGEGTSKNFDKKPFGFRLWTVTSPRDIKHEFVPLKSE